MASGCKDIIEAMKNHLNMFWEEKRLETFKSWPFGDDAPCSAYKLAEAGFYFTGSKRDPDSVQCFLCEKALDGWDEDDDPWAEHLSHSGKCTFAKLMQPERALTFKQMNNILLELNEKRFKKSAALAEDALEKSYNQRFTKLKVQLQARPK